MHIGTSFVTAVLGCLFLTSSTCYAGTIYACKKVVSGNVRILTEVKKKACSPSETLIAWPDLADFVALQRKVAINGTEITDLQETVAIHETEITDLQEFVENLSPADHEHDDRYYTKTEADDRYLPGSTLPAGVTLRGAWYTGADATVPPATMEIFARESISYGYSFAAALAGRVSGPATLDDCPGSLAAPEAAPGMICFYVNSCDNVNIDTLNFFNSNPFGIAYNLKATDQGAAWCYGTWAAAAPAPAPAP
jgi:hypothetical protein